MSDKKKFTWQQGKMVAKELCDLLRPITERLIVAGSMRRRCPLIGDIEILYIPVRGPGDRVDMFQPAPTINLTDKFLLALIAQGLISKRPNKLGHDAWGDRNKLAIHLASGIPVDFFSTEPAFWFNYLVCRTGPAQSNTRIASAAKAKGWMWNPTRGGFTDEKSEFIRVTKEQDVFNFVGLPYREPQDRV